MIGAVISLVQLLRAPSRPHVAFLGRIPGTRRFSDRERHPDNELVAGVLIFRPESPLVYFNVDPVCEVIRRRVRAEPTPPGPRRARSFSRTAGRLTKRSCARRDGGRNHCQRHSLPGSRSAVLGAGSSSQRRHRGQVWQRKPIHNCGRCSGEFPTDSSNGRMIISYQGYDKSFAVESHSPYLIRPRSYIGTCPRCLILAETGEKL